MNNKYMQYNVITFTHICNVELSDYFISVQTEMNSAKYTDLL